MASITLQEFADRMKQASSPAGIEKALNQLMAGMAIKGKTYAQQNYGKNGLGVVTGNLKRSIMGRALASQDGIGILLQAGNRMEVKYAAQHEFGLTVGGRKYKKRPYISPAIAYLRKELPDDIRDVVKAKVLGSPMVKV